MNTFRRGRADWISYKEEEGKNIPQGVIKLCTSGKMTKTRANSITNLLLLEFVTLMLVYSCEYKMISKYD